MMVRPRMAHILCAHDNVRLWQLDHFMDYRPTERLPPGIPLWSRQPGNVRRRIGLHHQPAVRIVIELMQPRLRTLRKLIQRQMVVQTTSALLRQRVLSMVVG
jgi:hypothetical protein